MRSRFVWEEGELEVSRCHQCAHYRGNQLCIAFPRGIPNEIYNHAFDHRKPYFGDGGFQFMPANREKPQ